MLLEEVWDGLDPETKHWFRQNPGCRALPRTIVNIIRDGYTGRVVVDQDGMMALSRADLQFLQSVAPHRLAPVGDSPRETK